jgi:hypothetical protein
MTPLSDDALQLIADGLEIPNAETVLCMMAELKKHNLTPAQVIAIELRRLRGVPNPDAV